MLDRHREEYNAECNESEGKGQTVWLHSSEGY